MRIKRRVPVAWVSQRIVPAWLLAEGAIKVHFRQLASQTGWLN